MAANANSEKVPSVISYSESGEVKSWGYEVGMRESSLSWFKILLETHPRYPQRMEEVKKGIARRSIEQLGFIKDVNSLVILSGVHIEIVIMYSRNSMLEDRNERDSAAFAIAITPDTLDPS